MSYTLQSNLNDLTLNNYSFDTLATITSSQQTHESFNKSNILYKTIVYSLTIPLFILTTVGNGVILITIKYQARLLSSNSNFFILSLALADFFVGVAIMPITIVFTANDQKWNHSQILCDFYICFDFLCSSASFLTLSAMSIERYKMLTTSYVQIKHSSKLRIITFVILSWLLPALTWTPAIIGYRHFKNDNSHTDNNVCEVQIDKYLNLVMTIVLYHVPLICMVTFYTKLIIHIRKSSNSMNNLDQIKTDYMKYYNYNRNHPSNNNNQQPSIKSNKTSRKSQNNDNLYNSEHSKHSNLDENFKFRSNFNKKNRLSLIDNNTHPNQESNHVQNCFGSTQTLEMHQNAKSITRIIPFINGNKKTKSNRSNSLNNSTLVSKTLDNNKKFRSNILIRLFTEKSSELKKSQRGKQSSHQQSQNQPKIDEYEKSSFINPINNNLEEIPPPSVRFQPYGNGFNENTNKEELKNKNLKEITYCFAGKDTPNNNNSKNLLSRLKSSIPITNSKSEINRSSFINDYNDYRQIRLKRNRKAARMLGLLVAAFLICWLPYTILYPLSRFINEDSIPNYATLISWWMGYLNSTINPFLYVYSNKNIRRSVRNLFCKRLIYSIIGNRFWNGKNFRSDSIKQSNLMKFK